MRTRKNDGSPDLGKKIVAGSLGVAVALCLAACGTENRAEATGAVSAPETQQEESSPRGEAAWQEERPSGEKAQSEIVDGVQLAAGYGIFSAGQPQVYVMKKEPEPIETEGAKAWLLSSIYQDGLFRFLVMVEDSSITEIPQQEAEKLELGEEVREMQIMRNGEAWYPDYFPIDKEQGIYGRSSFEEKAGYRGGNETENGDENSDAWEKAVYTITGAGVPGGTFSGREIWSARDYKSYLTYGSVTHNFAFYTEDMKLETAGPEGSYQITIPGFEDSFSIEFEKAPYYPDVEHIPGMVIKDGIGLMADGEWTKEGLAVTVYTWSEGTAGVTPEFSRLKCEADGRTGKGKQLRFQANRSGYGSPQEFLSRMEGRARTTYYYEIPEQFQAGDFFLESSGEISKRRGEVEQSEWLTVPIPEKGAELNLTAELEHCTITLISVEKEEPSMFVISGEDGQEEVRPCVSLGVMVKQKDGTKKVLQHIRIVQEEENPEDPYYDRWARGSYQNGRLTGILAYYKEGDQELKLRFENPEYAWYEAFRLPVQMQDAG